MKIAKKQLETAIRIIDRLYFIHDFFILVRCTEIGPQHSEVGFLQLINTYFRR